MCVWWHGHNIEPGLLYSSTVLVCPTPQRVFHVCARSVRLPPTMIRLVVVVSHRLHIGYHAHLCIGQTRLFALISVTIISLAPDAIDSLVFLRMDFQQRQIITCCLMRRKVRQIRKLVIMSHQKHGFTCVCVSVCVCVCESHHPCMYPLPSTIVTMHLPIHTS